MQRLMVMGLALTLAASVATADISMDLTPSVVSIGPGGYFDLTFALVTDAGEQVTGLSYLLGVDAGSAQFGITGRDTSGTPISSMISTTPQVIDPTAGSLDFISDRDLGATVPDLGTPAGPGTILLCTLTIQSQPSVAPGLYTFSPSELAVYGVFPFFEAYPGVTFTPATVQVVPEPGSVALLLLTLPSALLLRRRRN